MFQDWRHIKHFGDCSHFIDIVCGDNCQFVKKKTFKKFLLYNTIIETSNIEPSRQYKNNSKW